MRDLFEVTGLGMARRDLPCWRPQPRQDTGLECQDGVKLLPEGEGTAKGQGLRGKGRASQVPGKGCGEPEAPRGLGDSYFIRNLKDVDRGKRKLMVKLYSYWNNLVCFRTWKNGPGDISKCGKKPLVEIRIENDSILVKERAS